jgi:hypothetical protein
MAVLLSVTSGRNSAMDKPEAENIYDSGKKPTLVRLLEQDDQKKIENKDYLATSGLQQLIAKACSF